jgi:tol-pal system protein YbgF
MQTRKAGLIAGAALIALSVAVTGAGTGGGRADDKEKEMKLALDALRNEITLLERQIRSMQESMDRSGGQTSTLLTQISDNVNAIRQAQGRVAEAAGSAIKEVDGIGEKLSATNQRIDRISEQIALLRKLVENLPKLPTFSEINPGNPDQLFAAAYGDYSRGNYELALSEFRQYVESYPTSEMADNAQYWIGEVLAAEDQCGLAIPEYDKVITTFAKGDKVPAARLAKGKCLEKIGQRDAARIEWQQLVKLHPRSSEAQIATQLLSK